MLTFYMLKSSCIINVHQLQIIVIYTSCLMYPIILVYIMIRQDVCFLFIIDAGVVVPQFKQIISQAALLERIKAVTERNNPDSVQSNKVHAHTYKGHGRCIISVPELKVTICRCSFLRNS